MNLIKDWYEQKKIVTESQEKLHKIEEDIYSSIICDIPDEGIYKELNGDYQLSMTTKYSVKVDDKMACLYPHLFKTKFEYSKTIFKSLNDQEKEMVCKMITKTPAKPSFKVEFKNADN